MPSYNTDLDITSLTCLESKKVICLCSIVLITPLKHTAALIAQPASMNPKGRVILSVIYSKNILVKSIFSVL